MTVKVPDWRLQDRLKRSLDEAGISVQQFADELDLHRNTITNYLHGRKPPKAVLGIWALRTGVPYQWLVTGEEPDDSDDAEPFVWHAKQLELFKYPCRRKVC